ncbi:MAG: serine/threonine protein kinase [Planctomycetes bacterium]|nr:serine/threonine protein kinase [Planctomycetota bacterium]
MTSRPCPRCGASLPSDRLEACPRCLLEGEIEPELLGDSIELLAEIGRGGMGRVFKARHRRLGRTVAVKFLPPEVARDPEHQARFEREARALAMLDHPNIVRVYDAGGEGERAYVVMEFVEGPSLSKESPMPVRRALDVAKQVCDALAYAHARGIVHRDIKPQNLLVDADGRVKVADFGIARIVAPGGERFDVTRASVAVGTPRYMAPEALAGAPPDPRMDVYSLGATLYDLVMGRPPAGDFEPAPAPLDRILRRALAADPSRRYPNAEAMRIDVEAALSQRENDDLPADERHWVRGVAVVETFATAVVLWAALLSLTPREMRPDEVMPLLVLGEERLSGGRIVSRARFETWPSLAALAAIAVAILAYAVLRRHQRDAGLVRPRPDRRLRESRAVLVIGAIGMVVYGVRLALAKNGSWVATTIPILGGAIEIVALYFLWLAQLEAWRTSRPLWREPLLWIGFAFVLIPPVREFLNYVLQWHP